MSHEKNLTSKRKKNVKANTYKNLAHLPRTTFQAFFCIVLLDFSILKRGSLNSTNPHSNFCLLTFGYWSQSGLEVPTHLKIGVEGVFK